MWLGAVALFGMCGANAFAAAPASASAELVFIEEPSHDSVRVIESLQGPGMPFGAREIPLPKGYSNLDVDGHAYQVSGQTLFITPESRDEPVVFSFELPFHAMMGVQWTFALPWSLDQVQLLVPEDGSLAVSADQLLTSTRQADIGGTRFRILTRLGLPSGEEWKISVQRLPSVSASPPGSNLPLLGTPLGPSRQLVQAAANLALVALVFAMTVWGLLPDRRPCRMPVSWQREGYGVHGGTRHQDI
jgi:hypothetical protein